MSVEGGLPNHLGEALKYIMSRFVKNEYREIEQESLSALVSASDIEREITEYGRNLTGPDDLHFESVYFFEYSDSPNEYFVRMPFFTVEEGRSDLEVQLSLLFDEKNELKSYMIKNILVP